MTRQTKGPHLGSDPFATASGRARLVARARRASHERDRAKSTVKNFLDRTRARSASTRARSRRPRRLPARVPPRARGFSPRLRETVQRAIEPARDVRRAIETVKTRANGG